MNAIALLVTASLAGTTFEVLPPVAVDVGHGAAQTVLVDKLDELVRAGLKRRDVGITPVALDDIALPWVAEAKQLYYALEFPSAAREAERAVQYYENQPVVLGNGSSLLAAHLFAALSRMELRQNKKAGIHLRRIIQLFPDHQLSSAEYAPPVIQAFETARTKTRKGATGQLTVASKPAFAKVFVDGVAAGETPVSRDGLSVGRHFIRLELNGFVTAGEWVNVLKTGASTTVELKPTPNADRRVSISRQIASGTSDTTLAEARKLAASAEVDAVFLQAIALVQNGVLLTVAKIGATGTARAACLVAADLSDAPARVNALLAAAMVANQSAPAIEPDAARWVSFSGSWMGLEPPAPAAQPSTTEETTTATSAVAATDPLPIPEVAEEEDGSILSSPWLWVAVGAVAAGAAAGVTGWYLSQPSQPKIILHMELPR